MPKRFEIVFILTLACCLGSGLAPARRTTFPDNCKLAQVVTLQGPLPLPTDYPDYYPDRFEPAIRPKAVKISAFDGTPTIWIPESMLNNPESHRRFHWVRPLSFSPDGNRLAAEGFQDESGIYVLDQNFQQVTWVTRGWINANHSALVWAPDSRKLAVFSSRGDSSWVSVFENQQLRKLYRHLDSEFGSDVAMVWSKDSSTLFVAPPYVRDHSEIVSISIQSGRVRSIFRGDKAVRAMEWDPNYEELAFGVGNDLWVHDGSRSHILVGNPLDSIIGDISWSPDGTKVAVDDRFGELSVVDRTGRDVWRAISREKDQLSYRSNVAWLDSQRIAFIEAGFNPKWAVLYVGDYARKTVMQVTDQDLVFSTVLGFEGKVVYPKITHHGPWQDIPEGRDSPPDRIREVSLGLFFWDAEQSTSVQLPGDVVGEESEGNFGVYPEFALFVPVYR